MEEHQLEIREIGLHGHEELRKQLQQICYDFSYELLEGARRLECVVMDAQGDAIGFHHNKTEFTWDEGLMMAGGHDDPGCTYPIAEELHLCYEDLRDLLAAAAADVSKPFEIKVVKVYPPVAD